MKRFLKLTLCLVMLVVLAGCDSKSKDTDTKTKEEKTPVQETTKKEETKKGSSKALEELVESQREKIEGLSNSMLDVKFFARDNSIVYSYTYKNTYPSEQVSAMKEKLESTIKASSSVYTNLLASAKKMAPETKSVIIEYINGDGNLIAEIVFD